MAHGYEQVAFLGGPQFATSTQDRAAGFAKRLATAGMRLPKLFYANAYAYDAGRQAMVSLLLDRSIEAVFCGDDLICMGAMDAARDMDRQIPDDIGFLGFNDMNMAGWSAYNLTTIRQPIREIILESVDLVASLLDDPNRPPVSKIFSCAVVERKTLRPITHQGRTR